MPTFLALQCYKCNMMQVKHDKKSSNKWICSVCNEKQSVRKVFATSMAAKDIRKFVQDYNLSHNILRDQALEEVLLKAEERGGAASMCDDASSFNIFCGKFTHSHFQTESKWSEYLPPEIHNEGLCAETSQGALDDAKFVTTIPEKTGRKPKGRVAEEKDEQFSFQQQQGSSHTKRRNGKFLNKPIKSFTECHDDMQKENDLPSLWARKATSGLQVQKIANMCHRQQLFGYRVPSQTSADVSLQKRKDTGERVFSESNTNVISKMPDIPSGVKEKPVLKWATFLDSEEDVKDQRTCTFTEEEKHVSKWAKYMDFNEVKPGVEAMQASGRAANWGKFPDTSEDVFPKVGQSQELSSIWSLKAASNLECLNSSVKTELDDFFNTPCISEVIEEVHPLFQ